MVLPTRANKTIASAGDHAHCQRYETRLPRVAASDPAAAAAAAAKSAARLCCRRCHTSGLRLA
jgi:hypothetical protein